MLDGFVRDFAEALAAIDAQRPQWVSTTTGRAYEPGIGPHTETATVALIVGHLSQRETSVSERYRIGVPYPNAARQKCDLVAELGGEEWAIEIKMLRFMGDNGKPNDNILMHILSPYPAHRSALTDTSKLATSSFEGRRAILIYGYDYDKWPLDPAIEAFETLARLRVTLGPRHTAEFGDLVHPIHRGGRVFAWEVQPLDQ